MKKPNSFIIIGGDNRQLYMTEYLKSLGYDVSTYGLTPNSITDLKAEISSKDAVILPLPVTKDEKKLCSIIPIKESIDDIISFIKPEQPIFAGMISKGTESKMKRKNIKPYDYFKREEVTVMNTVPTVQGIIKAIIDNIDYTVFSSNCVIFGYGRVAKITADSLASLGAKITVCARKYGDIALAATKGYQGCLINEFYKTAKNAEIIINTVPSLVIDRKILQNVRSSCLIIDVSSAPFGVDFTSAYELGIKALQCPSLPGKVAPKTAGRIIADGILNIIREEYDG